MYELFLIPRKRSKNPINDVKRVLNLKLHLSLCYANKASVFSKIYIVHDILCSGGDICRAAKWRNGRRRLLIHIRIENLKVIEIFMFYVILFWFFFKLSTKSPDILHAFPSIL